MPTLAHVGRVALVLAAGLVLSGVPTGVAVSGPPRPDLPTANVKWDYQIGPAYKPRPGVAMVARDRGAKPRTGIYNSCYVNAYQTQPGETKWWKRKHNNLLLKKPGGGYVVDSYWGEILLDVSTRNKRAQIAKIVNRWINGCADDGFDAVEPDNLDSWTRSKHLLTKANAFALAALIIDHAHKRGLAIAQKNAAGQTLLGKKKGFDFAVAEECGRWRECGRYRKAYGNLVYVVEYRTKDFKYSCKRWGDQLSIIQRDRQVRGQGSAKYVYKSC